MQTAAQSDVTVITEDAVCDLVLTLLAGLLGKARSDLEHELLVQGSMMPVDSLDLFDIMAEFRTESGISVPKRKLKRRDMQSVRAFARFVSTHGRHR